MVVPQMIRLIVVNFTTMDHLSLPIVAVDVGVVRV